MNPGDLRKILQSPVHDVPVPDIIHDDFTGFVQHLENDPVVSNPDAIQRISTGRFPGIVRERVCRKAFNSLENGGKSTLLVSSGDLFQRCS
jgi:hypothetical protein